ncbi:Tegument antigen, variant 2 [Clonorchis sinensis]|uniref:Tegument antigen, variant 2 n=2 Tax=Clonorchis sinensis TaxID=79923 RepID=A0A8T1MHB7_CLOSI|nr:Tegument antigen, variant 2 [Clonorchis sinensis]
MCARGNSDITAIDTDEEEVITFRDLESYADRHNLDRVMVKKWRDLFDRDNTGVVSLSEFCQTLGLKPASIHSQRQMFVRQVPLNRSQIRVVMATMSRAMQEQIGEDVFFMTRDSKTSNEHLADRIKRHLDKRFGRTWQVVICQGSSWASFTHLPETAFFFQLDKNVYLIWKTPD